MLNLLALLLWPGSQSILTPVTYAKSPTTALLAASSTSATVAASRTSVTIT